MISVALSHDVDRISKTYQYVTQMISAFRGLNVKKMNTQIKSLYKSDPYWQFDKIIEIEKKYSVKSTFFILNESIKFQVSNLKSWKLALGRYKLNNPKLIKMINWLDENGWEIGVHGSFNSYKDINLLRKEKTDLEKILGHEVIGIRQHYLNIDTDTWRIQKKVGFKYDSTWGFTNGIGFKDKKIKPFKPLNNEFVVYPLNIMDYCFINEKSRWDKFNDIVKTIEKNNALLVINWHQRVFNEDEFPGFSENYIKIIEKLKNMNADFYTIGEYFKNNR